MCYSPLGRGQSLATQSSSGFFVPRKKKLSIQTSIRCDRREQGVTRGILWQNYLVLFETTAVLVIKEELQLFEAARLNSEDGEAAALTT